jgi:hypothetical protein
MPRPFEFQPGDAEALAGLVRHARKHAKNHPVIDPRRAADPSFGFNFGAWHCRLTLDSFLEKEKPHWHASTSIMEEVGEEPVVLENGIVASMPQDALLAVKSWTEEHSKQAEFLLGELLAHAILFEDQQVLVADGLFARHALTKVVGG